MLTPRDSVVARFMVVAVVSTFWLSPKLPLASRPADALLALALLMLVLLLPERVTVPTPMLGGFFLLAGTGLVASLWTGAVSPLMSLIKTLWVFIWGMGLLVVVRMPGGRGRLVKAYCVGALLGSITVIAQATGHTFGLMGILFIKRPRAPGLYYNSNLGASHLLIAIFLFPLCLQQSRWPVLWLAAWVVAIWAFWINQSLGALAGLLVASLLLLPVLWLTPRFSTKRWATVLSVGVLGVACWQFYLLCSAPEGRQLGSQFRILEARSGMAAREVGWHSSLQVWASSPWVGIGRGRLSWRSELAPASGHNEYLTTLAEAGLLGLAGLMLLLGYPLWCGIRAMLRRDSELDVVVLCLAAYVAELVMGWGHDILHFRHLWVVMAILMSFTSPRHVRVAARRRFEAQESEPTDRP